MRNNYIETRERIGYTPVNKTGPDVYRSLGLICGLEVHQQLKTDKKLFCHCPAGIFQKHGQYDAEIIRHMRPTLSEMGGYDGTALMEFRTKKNIVYRIANSTTCTYDIDDTPPFKINHQALEIALEVALLLKTNIVGELHITRKQYLDGSIPTGFQRTGILSIEGQIPIENKTVRIIQLSIEEDSCREISDKGHIRIYTTDRLGIPLIEVVTYPDMKTPNEAAEAAQYIRFLTRSTGKVRTGIGAAREDVNVSISGGTRVEIKGVSHISYIPKLVHNEAFRQKSLLVIRSVLLERIPQFDNWSISSKLIDFDSLRPLPAQLKEFSKKDYCLMAVNLPGFKDILSFFTQPERMFSDEISDRLKVIACIEKPNMVHSEDWYSESEETTWKHIRKLFNAKQDDAQILFWGPNEDMAAALETIEERCKMAFDGVPKETRKSFKDGTTMFERVLPGSDRMYPDTDSAPISISEDFIAAIRGQLPIDINNRIKQLKDWNVPSDAHRYLLRRNFVPLIERISLDFGINPRFTAILLAQRFKYLENHLQPNPSFDSEKIYEIFSFINKKNIHPELVKVMLPVVYSQPELDMVSVLENIDFHRNNSESILALIPSLHKRFIEIKTSRDDNAELRWIMKKLGKMAMGNIPLSKLAEAICKGGVPF